LHIAFIAVGPWAKLASRAEGHGRPLRSLKVFAQVLTATIIRRGCRNVWPTSVTVDTPPQCRPRVHLRHVRSITSPTSVVMFLFTGWHTDSRPPLSSSPVYIAGR